MDGATLLAMILGGTVGGATIKLLDNVIQWALNRWGKRADEGREKEKRDRQERDDAEKALWAKVDATCKGQRVILYDRIKYLGEKYILAGEIDIDDRRNLNNMHDVYHNDLGGNGDFAILMKQVNHLPLKK